MGINIKNNNTFDRANGYLSNNSDAVKDRIRNNEHIKKIRDKLMQNKLNKFLEK